METPGKPPTSVANEPMSFGSADLRLSGRQWVVVAAVMAAIVLLTPPLWARLERFETGADYRLPYPLSRDYWLYSRRLAAAAVRTNVLVMGDSVVWGEYVRADGSWPHWLNREAKTTDRFINAGVNGMFPLALEGLAAHHAPFPRGQKVLLHCNLLWLSSPQADLSSTKEEHFNHSRLVPQWSPRIPCYRADANERMAAWIQNRAPILGWVNHLQIAYFDQMSLTAWTLADDGADPPQYPNLFRNPLAQITMAVPPEPARDPQRGPESPRHRPWSAGKAPGTARFDWAPLDSSLQWAAFRRLVERLQSRGADLFVVVGPFNEHMLADENRRTFQSLRDGVISWLDGRKIPRLAPEVLPSELYADASHPLTAGYELLARRTYADPGFRSWAAAP